jgi:aminoglycoside phosphotransferase
MEQFDGTVNAGRKGVAYDWQSLLVATESAKLDEGLKALVPQYAAD